MKKIKKSNIALGLAALTIISTVGFSSATLAANVDSSTATVNPVITTTVPRVRPNKFRTVTQAQKDVNKAARLVKKTAVDAALKANDYNAWVTAVGPNAPILQKINAGNFSRFVEAYNLRQQAQTIMTELGVSKGEGKGMGMAGHMEINGLSK